MTKPPEPLASGASHTSEQPQLFVGWDFQSPTFWAASAAAVVAFDAVFLAAVVVAFALLGADDFFAVVVAFLAVDLTPVDVFRAVDFVVLAAWVLVVFALAVVVP